MLHVVLHSRWKRRRGREEEGGAENEDNDGCKSIKNRKERPDKVKHVVQLSAFTDSRDGNASL